MLAKLIRQRVHTVRAVAIASGHWGGGSPLSTYNPMRHRTPASADSNRRFTICITGKRPQEARRDLGLAVAQRRTAHQSLGPVGVASLTPPLTNGLTAHPVRNSPMGAAAEGHSGGRDPLSEHLGVTACTASQGAAYSNPAEWRVSE